MKIIDNERLKALSSLKLALLAQSMQEKGEFFPHEPIAVIGMSCRFPGNGNTPAAFWKIMIDGVDAIKEIGSDRWDWSRFYDADPETPGKTNIRHAGMIDNPELFDPDFFNITPREARKMDPRQKMMLECAWEALEMGRCDRKALSGSQTGVFFGCSNEEYDAIFKSNPEEIDAYVGAGIASCIVANRISFVFNFHGPSMTVDTACSSSLVAMHLACQSLRGHECSLALTGGATLIYDPIEHLNEVKARLLSPDGRCKTFDHRANGYVRGEGGGVLVLKRLSEALKDRNPILGVIRGSAVNQDGKTLGISAPNQFSQVKVIHEALRNALLDAGKVTYVETHGTGTLLGDAVELEALAKTYGILTADAHPPCILGAVKTQIGHLEAAAGVAGVIKAILCLQKRMIPGNLHFEKLNPHVSLENTRLQIAVRPMEWVAPSTPRFAGVSSFGFGGANAHLILEEAPQVAAEASVEPAIVSPFNRRLFAIDRRNESRRNDTSSGLRESVTDHPWLGRYSLTVSESGQVRHVYEFLAGLNDIYALQDHRIRGVPIFPGAAYVDLALSVARSVHTKAVLQVEDLEFTEALYLPEPPLKRTVQVVLTSEEPDCLHIQFFSLEETAAKEDSYRWISHAAGKIRLLPAASPSAAFSDVSVERFQKQSLSTMVGPEFYLLMAEKGYQYGPGYQGVKQVWFGKGETLSRIVLPPAAAKERNLTQWHPALLDGVLQAAIEESNTDAFYLPIGLKKLTVHERPGEELWAYTIASEEKAAPGLKDKILDSFIFNDRLQPVAEFRGIRFRHMAQKHLPLLDDLYQPVWQKTELPLDAPGDFSERQLDWVIFSARPNLGERLYRELSARGDRCLVVGSGRELRDKDVCHLEADFQDRVQLERCLGEALLHHPMQSPGIIFIPERLSPDWFQLSTLRDLQEKAHTALLNLTKALHQKAEAFSPALWILSQNTQSLGTETLNPVHATLWGMGRTIALEYPAWHCRLIDGSTWDETELRLLIQMLRSGTPEDQLLVRASQAYVARLNPIPRGHLDTYRTEASLPPDEKTSFCLCLESAGSFQNLTFKAYEIPLPSPGEIQLRVEAAGLNFLDVLTALGTIPQTLVKRTPTDEWILGQECAGVVTAVGDGVERFRPGQRVAAIPHQGAFCSSVLASESLAVPIPDGMSFEDAATIPIAFMTAYYSLRYAARLSPGERVLIHAGTGGVGMAAIQTAQYLGAEIYATAGSEEKRRYLNDVLGVSHVADSRSLGFAKEIQEMTQGEGVDVVLNALAGEFIEKNLALLRPFGRFIEIGKRDVLENRKLGLRPFLDNLSYTLVDLLGMTSQYPKRAWGLFQEVMDHVREGHFTPLPKRIFPIANAREAFRFMAQAGHIGKIVLSFQEPPREIVLARKPCVRADGAYLITGGTGALGLEFARWLVEQGAGCVVLVSRHAPSEAVRQKIFALENGRTAILPISADVSKPEDVSRIMVLFRETHLPLKGVIHAAGVLNDAMMINQTEEMYAEVMAPKVAGAWNLHRATEDIPLDFFILFSSVVSVLGAPGQSNYAAANAFLDALAEYRTGQQKPALSINWGAWAGGGMVNERTERMIEREGSRKISVPQGVKLVEQVLTLDRLHRIVVLPLRFTDKKSAEVIKTHGRMFENAVQDGSTVAEDSTGTFLQDLEDVPEESRADMIKARVIEEVEGVYGPSGKTIDSTRSFEDLGFDSLMVMELKNQLEKILGTVIPTHLFESPTIDDFISQVAARLPRLQRKKQETAC